MLLTIAGCAFAFKLDPPCRCRTRLSWSDSTRPATRSATTCRFAGIRTAFVAGGIAAARIPRSRESWKRAADDDQEVDDLVLRVAVTVLVVAFASWMVLSLVVVLGRIRYDRRLRRPGSTALSSASAARLVRRVRAHPRTEWGSWRRVTALQRLERAHHPAVPQLVRVVLDDEDPRIAAAAIRTLGDMGDDWAIDILIDALRRGHGSRSRIAAELEALAPAPGFASSRSCGTGIPRCASGAPPCSDRTRGSPTRR